MSKKQKCLYTNMLNRLTILDEQIFQMQATLAKVREIVDSKFKAEPPDEKEPAPEPTQKERAVIEGATFATGHTVIHWLTPAPRGSIAFFDAFDDFIKIHVTSHPTNNTIITFEDGEQVLYRQDGTVDKKTIPGETE